MQIHVGRLTFLKKGFFEPPYRLRGGHSFTCDAFPFFAPRTVIINDGPLKAREITPFVTPARHVKVPRSVCPNPPANHDRVNLACYSILLPYRMDPDNFKGPLTKAGRLSSTLSCIFRF